jgi:hypothetical protein
LADLVGLVLTYQAAGKRLPQGVDAKKSEPGEGASDLS